MLNEERVKQMIRLASYESGKGREELRISARERKQYVTVNVWVTSLWVTAGYIALLAFLGMGLLGEKLKSFSGLQKYSLTVSLCGIYLIILICYIIKSRQYYGRKHTRAHYHVKKFRKDLDRLDQMYDMEDDHGENL